jgi:hypothetical protein
MIIVWLLRLLVIIAGAGMVGYLLWATSKPQVWKTDPNDPEHIKTMRTQERGTVVSIISGIILTIVSMTMIALCVRDGDIEVLFGYILAPIIGYILDIGIGTDQGFAHLVNRDFPKWIQHIMSSLYNYSFIRFIVTFLLDMFISKPISGVIRGYSLAKLQAYKTTGLFKPLDNFIKTNLTGIVQSIVSFVTFQAYTNQTRFLWAYPSPSISKDERIPSFAVMIATAIAASVYLISYRTDKQYLELNIAFVMIALGLISLLSITEQLEAPYQDEKPELRDAWLGSVLFMIFIVIGIILPLFNRDCHSNSSKITDNVLLDVLKTVAR